MRGLIPTFLVVIAVGGATGASASGDPGSQPPSAVTLPSDATCTQANDTMTCFYPAHVR